MQRAYVILVAFVVSAGATIGIFLYISLLPYTGTIGRIAAGVVIVGLICVAVLMITFTFSKASNWILRRHVITYGEIAVYLAAGGEVTHFSAMHEAAKVAQLPPPKIVEEEPLPSTDDTVLELYGRGVSLRDIVKATGRTYYQVQKLTAGK